MSIFEALILGIVQGLAEFLPISSSGHLALLQHFFGIDGSNVLTFTVLLHFGTLIAVFVCFWSDIWSLIKEFFALIADIFTWKGVQVRKNDTRKLLFMIIVATIPAGVVGVLFDKWIERVFTSIIVVGACLIVTGTILFIAERISGAEKGMERTNFRNAFVVGLFQAVALLPGISRSGSTIVGGLFLGFTRELAVRFAFLISIPSVLGATVLEVPAAMKAGLTGDLLLPTALGVIAAAVSGYFAIKAMIRLVTGKKLFVFSIYTWAVGAIVVAGCLAGVLG